MTPVDRNMLHLLDILKAQGRLRFEKEFCEVADMQHQNLSRVRKGERHFTPENIRNVCTGYMVNANWVFGFEHQVFRNVSNVNSKVNTVNLETTH